MMPEAREKGDAIICGMADAAPAHPGATVAERRACLRLLSYGLYAVTVHRGSEDSSFTANWLTQVSFDPPLLALSVENDSHSITLIHGSGIFTVNLLPRDATETAGTLGRRWAKVPDKLERVGWDAGPNGCAVLHEALGYIECAVDAALPVGDSTLFVARITGARLLRSGPPLTMAETPFKHAG